MTYTSTPPTDPGFYAWKSSTKTIHPVMAIVSIENDKAVVNVGNVDGCPVEHVKGLWSSRLIPLDALSNLVSAIEDSAGHYNKQVDRALQQARALLNYPDTQNEP